MDEKAFDDLVDNATYAVLALIPDSFTLNMGDYAKAAMRDQLNDYLAEALAFVKGATNG